MAMVIMNLYIAVVLEGFAESTKENEATITPDDFEKFHDRWAEYDPNASEYITSQELVFVLHEIHPPLGFLHNDWELDGELFTNAMKIKQRSLEKRGKTWHKTPHLETILSQIEIFKTLQPLNLKDYDGGKVHY